MELTTEGTENTEDKIVVLCSAVSSVVQNETVQRSRTFGCEF